MTPSCGMASPTEPTARSDTATVRTTRVATAGDGRFDGPVSAFVRASLPVPWSRSSMRTASSVKATTPMNTPRWRMPFGFRSMITN